MSTAAARSLAPPFRLASTAALGHPLELKVAAAVIPVGSPRRVAARAFAIALRRAMAKRSLGPAALAKLCEVADTSIAQWSSGKTLPRLASAKRLADALDCEELSRISVAGHTRECPVDHVRFTFDGSPPRLYCSTSCRSVHQNARDRDALELSRAVTVRRLELYSAAVDAMCRSCQPDGLCFQADCELRGVSPLPLSEDADSELRSLRKRSRVTNAVTNARADE